VTVVRGWQSGGVPIAIEPARQPEVEAMLRAGEKFARSLYPADECFMLDIGELESPGVTVWVARRGGIAVGMASLVVSGEHPELKRLFVSEDARGVGPAGNLLDAVEKHARDASARVIQLETGNLSDAAIALYEKRGYRHIPRFGGYVGSQSSVCMELEL
uniref:GNAT family N-acetyltransferase n=1 Tax=Salinibacterium sp. TaxID=1915057 RepID=UPI00286B7FC8